MREFAMLLASMMRTHPAATRASLVNTLRDYFPNDVLAPEEKERFINSMDQSTRK